MTKRERERISGGGGVVGDADKKDAEGNNELHL